MRRNRFALTTLLLVIAHGVAQSANPVAVQIPGADSPAVFERLQSTEGLTALAIGPDLELLAVAFLEHEKPQRSSLLLYSGDAEPARVEVAGRFRDLLFASDRSRIYGLLHKAARKTAGETHLMVYEIERAKLRRALRVSTTARSLDHWTTRGALLIAGFNEIRTLTLPDLRSGPLFRVLGENLAVTSIGGGDLVLVGQPDSVILVGLSDPPGQFEMPIRARVTAPGPVVALASSPDGSATLARIEDGRLFGVTLNPLRLEEQGTTAVLVSVEGHDDPPPAAPGKAAAPAAADPNAADAPATGPPAAAADSPHPTEPSRSTSSPAQVSGQIVGSAKDAVVAVVLLGPDNLLREAARIAPDSDGLWEANGLAPGRYRVQLDGGGGRVLVSQPAFLLLQIEPGRNAVAPEFRVHQAL